MEKDSPVGKGIIAAADSHVGLVRKANEDSFGYFIDRKRDYALFAVADGIGGHGNGDVASAICIRMMLEDWRQCDFSSCFDGEAAREFFRRTIRDANRKIFDINNRFSFRYPMGTTVVAAILTATEVVAVHIGDSRLYRFSADRIMRVTEDHSFVAEMVKNKLITPEEAVKHPFAHIISRSIGPNETTKPDFSTFERRPGDGLLLCSDGVSNYIADAEFEERFRQDRNPQVMIGNLLKMALKRGGEDNITAIGVSY
ncbi:MAG: protein phosphatase 2C domain-containing protein [Victivallales bacterium]|nr:protein phosphatase 2C domain-containing protein [Victivallales bacterium]